MKKPWEVNVTVPVDVYVRDCRKLKPTPPSAIPEGCKPLPRKRFILDNDCRKCTGCGKRSQHRLYLDQIYSGEEWVAYEDARGGKHYHYPGFSRIQMTCAPCGYVWHVKINYECWCGWSAVDEENKPSG